MPSNGPQGVPQGAATFGTPGSGPFGQGNSPVASINFGMGHLPANLPQQAFPSRVAAMQQGPIEARKGFHGRVGKKQSAQRGKKVQQQRRQFGPDLIGLGTNDWM